MVFHTRFLHVYVRCEEVCFTRVSEWPLLVNYDILVLCHSKRVIVMIGEYVKILLFFLRFECFLFRLQPSLGFEIFLVIPTRNLESLLKVIR